MSARNLGILRAVLILATALLVTGCATINSKKLDGFGHPFAGTRDTPSGFACMAAFGKTFPIAWVALPFLLIDVPLSIVADISLLPFDLTNLKSEQKSKRTCA